VAVRVLTVKDEPERCRRGWFVELVGEFYNNVCALLPLLMLTKVVDRHRRQHMQELAIKVSERNEQLRHRIFMVLVAATEVLALLSAGWDHHNAWLDGLLIVLVALCGVFFTVELVAGRLAPE
jgi:hypothetical protein